MFDRSLRPRAGYDLGPQVNFDGLGKAYLAIAVVWSVIVLAGVTFLILLRNLTFIRIRNVTLSTAAVLTIHVYLVLVFLVYVLNGRYPCSFEYWIMSTYFPIGIALFQAQNVLLLDVSGLQKRLMKEPLRRSSLARPQRRGLAGWLARWREMNLIQRTYFCIVVGIVTEVCLAAL